MKGKSISVSFETPLAEASFIERPNRFLIRCELQQKPGSAGPWLKSGVVEAHLPDPGRLKELLIPGRKVWLRRARGQRRKTKWSVALSEAPGREGLVSIDSTLPNRLIAKALAAESMQELKEWSLVRQEFTMGASRWDFLLADSAGCRLLLEVKSVTLVKDGVGLFPDAVTARGAKHLHELARVAQMPDWKAAVLFVVQRNDAMCVEVARGIDPLFAAAFSAAREAGVNVFGRKCYIAPEKVTLGEELPVR